MESPMLSHFVEDENTQYQIQTASIPPSLIPLFLRNKLHPLLPFSLPLYRRCQFFLRELHLNSKLASPKSNPSRPGEPELWIAVAERRPTGPQSTTITATEALGEDWLKNWVNSPEQPPSDNEENRSHFLAVHIDIREPGQTQSWLFGSWEVAQSLPVPAPINATSTPFNNPEPLSHAAIFEITITMTPTPSQKMLAHHLHARLRTHHIPTLPVTPTRQFERMIAEGKKMTVPYCRSRVTFGTVAERSEFVLGTDPYDNDNDTQHDTAIRLVRADKSYLKHLLHVPLPPPTTASAPSSDPITSTPLPPPPTPFTNPSKVHPNTTITASPLQKSHLQTMLDRSTIPRALETLQNLPSIGLFLSGSSNPVAWGILTKDASIGSMHTEDEYRGRGLAEMVVRELVGRTKDGVYGGDGEDDVEWAHTDISSGNRPSRRVFEKLGAVVGWKVGWYEIDFDSAEV